MRVTHIGHRLASLMFLAVLGLALVGGLLWALNPVTPPEVERVAGEDRYATAAAVAITSRPDGAETVYVATGADFPDALAAGPLAADGGALLLVDSDELPLSTAAALDHLEPDVVVLLGGSGVISDHVAEAIAARTGAEVSRVAGEDRFETAARLALEFDSGVSVAYITDGLAFADALAGGAAAGTAGGPVLLVRSEEIPSVTAAALEHLEPDALVVLGGEAAVSEAVRGDLERFTDGDVLRLAGADRYETAVAVSRDAFDRADVVHLANGDVFADALAGVAAAGGAGGPLLLSEEDCVPDVVLDEIERLRAARVVLLGGEASLAQPVGELTACGRAPLL